MRLGRAVDVEWCPLGPRERAGLVEPHRENRRRPSPEREAESHLEAREKRPGISGVECATVASSNAHYVTDGVQTLPRRSTKGLSEVAALVDRDIPVAEREHPAAAPLDPAAVVVLVTQAAPVRQVREVDPVGDHRRELRFVVGVACPVTEESVPVTGEVRLELEGRAVEGESQHGYSRAFAELPLQALLVRGSIEIHTPDQVTPGPENERDLAGPLSCEVVSDPQLKRTLIERDDITGWSERDVAVELGACGRVVRWMDHGSLLRWQWTKVVCCFSRRNKSAERPTRGVGRGSGARRTCCGARS